MTLRIFFNKPRRLLLFILFCGAQFHQEMRRFAYKRGVRAEGAKNLMGREKEGERERKYKAAAARRIINVRTTKGFSA